MKLTPYQEESIKAIAIANENGFNFDFNQKNTTTYFYEVTFDNMNLKSIYYTLIRVIIDGENYWRISSISKYSFENDSILTENLSKNKYNRQPDVNFVCMFKIN
jgi:hypothetical protein